MGPGNLREGPGGAKHVGVCFDLLPRWRHVPCGRGSGVTLCHAAGGSAMAAPQRWRQRQPFPPCKIQDGRCWAEAVGSQENRQWRPSFSIPSRGAGLCLSTTPTLPGVTQQTCYSLSTLLHFPVQLFCFVCLVFSFWIKKLQRG